jgi:hypothetical protein
MLCYPDIIQGTEGATANQLSPFLFFAKAGSFSNAKINIKLLKRNVTRIHYVVKRL